MKVTLPNRDKRNPDSYPFITGDTFRAFADIIIMRQVKEYSKFRTENVWWQRPKNR